MVSECFGIDANKKHFLFIDLKIGFTRFHKRSRNLWIFTDVMIRVKVFTKIKVYHIGNSYHHYFDAMQHLPFSHDITFFITYEWVQKNKIFIVSGWKGILGTNTPAYLAHLEDT
jgi:hypothetical protein